MKWLRFSLRSMLVLVAIAALGSLGLRWYLDRPYARVERAMEAIWRDNPTAGIGFDGKLGILRALGVGRLSPDAAMAICDAELVVAVRIDCKSRNPAIPSLPEIRMPPPVTASGKTVESPTLTALRVGFGESITYAPPGEFGVGTRIISAQRIYDPKDTLGHAAMSVTVKQKQP